MKFNLNGKEVDAGQFMTPRQFMAILEGRKCSHCDKKARWIHEDGAPPSYCDEHFPYLEEKRREAAKEWEDFKNMPESERIAKIRELHGRNS